MWRAGIGGMMDSHDCDEEVTMSNRDQAVALPDRTTTPAAKRLAQAAIAGQLLFVAGWLVAGALEGHGYSALRHDVSDLGALTAHHPWLAFGTSGVGGLLTIVFALGALRPSLATPGHPAWLPAALVALSLPALDSFGDAFFRLDCRAADTGCTMSRAASSWHGKLHLIVFAVAALCTLAAPFVLAARMRAVDGWRDLARPTRRFGAAFAVLLVLTIALGESSVAGLVQRVVIVVVVIGVVVLAGRVASAPRAVAYAKSSEVQSPLA